MSPRKPRFYHPHPLKKDTLIQLEPDAAQHVTRVLRMKVDEKIILFDNQGGEYVGIIKSLHSKVDIYVSEYHDCHPESALKLHLGQSLTRADKMDMILQKATELGVHTITPIMTRRSMIKLQGKALDKKMAHWHNIIISAAQQSGRTHLPILNRPLDLGGFLKIPFEGVNIGFDPKGSNSLKSLAHTHSIRLLLGPESGLDPLEVALAQEHGFTFYTLGPRVLRAETASLAGICALQLLYGDLS